MWMRHIVQSSTGGHWHECKKSSIEETPDGLHSRLPNWVISPSEIKDTKTCQVKNSVYCCNFLVQSCRAEGLCVMLGSLSHSAALISTTNCINIRSQNMYKTFPHTICNNIQARLKQLTPHLKQFFNNTLSTCTLCLETRRHGPGGSCYSA